MAQSYSQRMPERIRIACVQMMSRADKAANLERVEELMVVRARAIENQCFAAAAAQLGETMPGRRSYGRSLIVDPWGVVVAEAPDEETVVSAELDRARLRKIREQLPSLANRRPDAYRWPAPA